MSSLTEDSGGPPHEPAKYDGDQNLPRIPVRLVRPTKSGRSRRDETPLRELTRWESAFGGYRTSRWTWSSSPLNSAKVGSRLGVGGRRYVVCQPRPGLLEVVPHHARAGGPLAYRVRCD